MRRIVGQREGREKLSDWIAFSTPDFDKIVQTAMERVLKALDLPRRSDIDALNKNLQRVADAVEKLDAVRREARASEPAEKAPSARVSGLRDPFDSGH